MPVSLTEVRAGTVRALPHVWVANAGPVTIDLGSLDDARVWLGITSPVRITWTNGRGGRSKAGMHMHARTDRGAHDVRVVRGQSAAEISRTLWHELEHARQSEHVAGFARMYATNPRPWEAQAVAREREHERWPLVVGS